MGSLPPSLPALLNRVSYVVQRLWRISDQLLLQKFAPFDKYCAYTVTKNRTDFRVYTRVSHLEGKFPIITGNNATLPTFLALLPGDFLQRYTGKSSF
jgi:hypothetical protein